MINEYFGFAVGVIGLSPDYFWHELTMEELASLFDAYNKRSRDSWEQTRVIAYNSVQWGKKAPKIQKFMPFKWDNEMSESISGKKRTIEDRKKFASNLTNALNINKK